MSEDAAENQAEEIVALCLPLEYIGSTYHHALTDRIAAALREAGADPQLVTDLEAEIARLKAALNRYSEDETLCRWEAEIAKLKAELEAARNQLRDGVVCVKCGGDFTNFDELCHKCSDELRLQVEQAAERQRALITAVKKAAPFESITGNPCFCYDFHQDGEDHEPECEAVRAILAQDVKP